MRRTRSFSNGRIQKKRQSVPKKMVSWRLDVELLERLKDEAERLDMDVTELVEEKLSERPKLDEILRTVRRIEKGLVASE